MSEELRFDATDRPAAGTACAQCRTGGHFCPAKGYRGEDALCLACGAGQPCEQAGAVLRMERGGQWDEMQVDERSTLQHGECRQVAITDADRAADAQAGPASAWTIKAELSAANLVRAKRAKPVVVTARRKQNRKFEAERDAGRRKRMSEVNAGEKLPVKLEVRPQAPPVLAAFCAKGCGRPARHTGRCAGAMPVKLAQKPAKTLALRPEIAETTIAAPEAKAAPSVEDGFSFTMIRASGTGAAVGTLLEKLIAELAGR